MKLLKLSKNNCRSCDMMEMYLKEKEVQTESVNVEEQPEIAAEHRVMGVPVLLLLDDDGKEVKRTTGFSPEEIDDLVSQL